MLKVYRLKLKQNSYEVTLHYKGVGVRVAFTDGNIYNGTPARCYERDPFKQKAIEASPMFKNKEIVVERTVEDKAKTAASASQRSKRASRIGAPVMPTAKKPAPVAAPQVSDPDPEPSPEPEPQKTSEKADEVTFDSLSEAIVHVMQKYQKEMRTANEVRNFLKEQGITAHIKQG